MPRPLSLASQAMCWPQERHENVILSLMTAGLRDSVCCSRRFGQMEKDDKTLQGNIEHQMRSTIRAVPGEPPFDFSHALGP